jgi:hypothetical protein
MLDGFLGAGHDDETAYEWGEVFASPWPEIVRAMDAKAAAVGAEQEVGDEVLVWRRDGVVQVRFVFVDDPSDMSAIRAVYNDDANVASPASFIIVKQPDPTDDRGAVIFDIFMMSPRSYLWHFHRVFTRP